MFKNYESQSSIHKTKVLKSTDKYFVYTREISSEVNEKLNYIPRTSDVNVKKLSRKV